jgi:hypothetical protein
LVNFGEVTTAQQATSTLAINIANMEAPDVVMKISRVVDRSSHGLSKVVTRCHQGRQGRMLVVALIVMCPEQ